MKKSIPSNNKIKYTLLSILFSILFIFTALNISSTLTAYAEDDVSIGQTLNLGSFSANETDESSNEQAGYLYWAASGERSGIYYYVVDNYGWIRANGIIMDDAYGGGQYYGDYCTSGKVTASSKLGAVSTLGSPSVQYQPNVSTVFYSGGWQSKGSESMAYLTEIIDEIVIKGVRMPCPRWAKLVALQSGGTVLEELAKPDTKWNIFVEPVSVGYMYTDETFSEETANTVHTDKPFAAGSPKPVGTANADGSFTPKVYGTTASSLLSQSVRIGDTGRYRYKFYETQLPFSLCLDHDTDSYMFTGGSSSVLVPVTKCDKSVQRLSYIAPHEGIAIASIDITGFTLPPIHTFDESQGTPGNTEPPSPDNGTDGDCTIKKLYYTQKISSDGTILTEATDYHYYTQTSTTAYISIDTEEGYEIEGWKASSTNRSLRQKSDYTAVSPVLHTGESAQEILLDKDNGEKYLYII